MPVVHLLDYVAGNIRSLVNAIEKLGYQVEWVKSPDDVHYAEVSRNLNASGFFSYLIVNSETHFAWCWALWPLPYPTF